MPDYQQARIYQIWSIETEKIYIGSTCSPLRVRLAQHVYDYKRFLNGMSPFISSFEILKEEHYDIELVENFPCNSKEELHARENHWIREFKEIAVNRKGAKTGMTQQEIQKEYREKNREKILLHHKKYNEKNKEKWAEKVDCFCGGRYTLGRKNEHFRTNKHIDAEIIQQKNTAPEIAVD